VPSEGVDGAGVGVSSGSINKNKSRLPAPGQDVKRKVPKPDAGQKSKKTS
jgi:hypothetical protein